MSKNATSEPLSLSLIQRVDQTSHRFEAGAFYRAGPTLAS